MTASVILIFSGHPELSEIVPGWTVRIIMKRLHENVNESFDKV